MKPSMGANDPSKISQQALIKALKLFAKNHWNFERVNRSRFLQQSWNIQSNIKKNERFRSLGSPKQKRKRGLSPIEMAKDGKGKDMISASTHYKVLGNRRKP
mmetsp:Transcript_37511/g.57468  ORF Transcript_37511/g.57468 Transcript_37511/m.57468 type:complete len:102 (-) Transcript_37511:58-363(-)